MKKVVKVIWITIGDIVTTVAFLGIFGFHVSINHGMSESEIRYKAYLASVKRYVDPNAQPPAPNSLLVVEERIASGNNNDPAVIYYNMMVNKLGISTN